MYVYLVEKSTSSIQMVLAASISLMVFFAHFVAHRRPKSQLAKIDLLHWLPPLWKIKQKQSHKSFKESSLFLGRRRGEKEASLLVLT